MNDVKNINYRHFNSSRHSKGKTTVFENWKNAYILKPMTIRRSCFGLRRLLSFINTSVNLYMHIIYLSINHTCYTYLRVHIYLCTHVYLYKHMSNIYKNAYSVDVYHARMNQRGFCYNKRKWHFQFLLS